jgi:hypothetical protein
VSAPNTYLPYDLPLWLSRTLRRSARRAGPNRRCSIVWGCSLLTLRPRSWMTPSSARASLALRWRLPQGSDLPTRERIALPVPPHVASQQQKPAAVAPPSRRETSWIRAQAMATSAGTLGAPAMPNWNRVPRSAGRRDRRHARSPTLLGPQMLSCSTPYRPISPGLPRPEPRVEQLVLPARTPANNQPSNASVTGPGFSSSSNKRKQRVATGTPDPVESVDPLPPIRGASHQTKSRRVAAAGGLFEPLPLPEPVHLTGPLAWHPAVMAAVWPRVTRLIEREIARRAAAAEPSAFPAEPARLGGQPPVATDAAPEVTDRMVAQVLTRLRAVAREERFRAGRLR